MTEVPVPADKPSLAPRVVLLGLLLGAAVVSIVFGQDAVRHAIFNDPAGMAPAALGGGVFVVAAWTLLGPATRAGRVARLLLAVPACAFVLVVLADALVHGGHPSLGSMVALGTAALDVVLVPIATILLAVAWLRGERLRFGVLGIAFAALAVVYSTALLMP